MRPLNWFKFYKLKVITYDISGQGSLPGRRMLYNIFSEKVLYHVLISIVVAISGTPEKMKQNQKKSNPNSNYLPYIGSIKPVYLLSKPLTFW